MHSFVRLVGVIAVVLFVPMATTALWYPALAAMFDRWQENPPATAGLATALVLVLAADILLPVPSGPVITLAGGQLGVVTTSVAAWCGLMLGGLVAFALAKRLGPAVTGRLVPGEDLVALKASARRHDAWLLLVTRPLPILAEATVLVCGTLDTSWYRLLWTLTAGNAAVALAFAMLGQQANEQEWLVIAIVLSVMIPLALTWFVRRRWLRSRIKHP